MNLIDIYKISFAAIRSNKARAILTTLGIVIGISAVIAMLSIGQGAQAVIVNQVQGLGANTISILPVANFSPTTGIASFQALATLKLDEKILVKLQNKVKFPEVESVSGYVNSNFEVGYRGRSALSGVNGVDGSYFAIRDLKLKKGRLLTATDSSSNKKVAVVGAALTDKLFGLDDPIGKFININGTQFLVVGLTEPKNLDLDDRVFIPFKTAQSSLVGVKGYSQIVVKASAENLIDPLAVKIDEELRDFYHLSDKDKDTFTVLTSKDVQSLAESVTSIFTTLLASVASISLIVGGIGIMNIMLVSVTERTKEIGLRKAVGAKRQAILGQFLMEAVLLTLIGGIIGITLGIGLGLIVGKVGNFDVVLSWQSIALATSVSVGIGLIFGFYPAYRAARLNPIDALRYE